MRLPTWQIVLVAAAVAVCVGVLPPALRHWAIRSAEIGERARFARTHAADMVREYPSFMGTFVEQNAHSVAEGSFWPVVERAWETNTLVCTVRAIAHWIATNFLVRALSPQSVYDLVGLAALLILTLAGLHIGGTVYSNIMMARTFRHNTKLMARSPLSSSADITVEDE